MSGQEKKGAATAGVSTVEEGRERQRGDWGRRGQGVAGRCCLPLSPTPACGRAPAGRGGRRRAGRGYRDLAAASRLGAFPCSFKDSPCLNPVQCSDRRRDAALAHMHATARLSGAVAVGSGTSSGRYASSRPRSNLMRCGAVQSRLVDAAVPLAGPARLAAGRQQQEEVARTVLLLLLLLLPR